MTGEVFSSSFYCIIFTYNYSVGKYICVIKVFLCLFVYKVNSINDCFTYINN